MSISRVNNFDLIRLFAAIQVAIVHGYEHFELKGQVQFLDILITDLLIHFPGVPIFFAMSGFLIFNSFSRNRDLRRYIQNRFLRLFPGLWVSFFTTVAALIYFDFINWETIASKDILSWVFAQLTLFQFYTPEILRPYALGNPNGSLWTIVVEIQYYIFVPIFFYLMSKIRVRTNYILLLLVLLSVSANFFVKYNFAPESMALKLAKVFLAPYLFYFLLGALLYVNFERLARYFENRALIAFYSYMIFSLVFSNVLGLYRPAYWPDPMGLLSTLILTWLVFTIAFSNHQLSERVLKGTDISYGLYIYHMIVLNFMLEKFQHEDLSYFIIYMAISILLGYASWKLVELPMLKLKRTLRFNETNHPRP